MTCNMSLYVLIERQTTVSGKARFEREEQSNNVTGEVIFSAHDDALAGDGSLLPLLHDDVVLLRKSRGSPFVAVQLRHRRHSCATQLLPSVCLFGFSLLLFTLFTFFRMMFQNRTRRNLVLDTTSRV